MRCAPTSVPASGRPLRLVLAALAAGLLAVGPAVAQQRPAYPSARHGGNYMHNFYLPPMTAATPWAPSWSPDGRSLAVALNGSIWRVDAETGDARELTSDALYHSAPDWSPDGRFVVYTATDGIAMQLRVLEVASGRSSPLTDDEWIHTDPRFSPDGGRIAYVSTRPEGHFNVYVRPFREGAWAGDEIAVTRDHAYPRSRLYFGEWDMHLMPAWLPGGEELLLVSNRDVPLGSGDVWRVPAEPGGFERRRRVLKEQTLYRTRPDVSPDGARFVYSSTAGAADQYSNLYVLPVEGGAPYKLTFFEHDAFHPRWSPDGRRIAFVENAGGLPRLAVLETFGGAHRLLPIGERRWGRPVGTLAVRTVDAGTGEVTGSRIHLEASDGRFYAPGGAYARQSGRGDHLFHTAGRFRLELPEGRTRLVAVKGFEFEPVEAEAEVRPGEVGELTLRLERTRDMAARGWYSGSTHVHMNYGGNLHNTLENLLMMSEAEDQDVVNELVANKDNRILDYQHFVPGGGPHPLSTPERLLVVGQEYRPPFWGHVFMLGLRDHLISPFTTGYEGTGVASPFPSNTDMLRKALAQGATVGYVHPFGGDADPLEGSLGGGRGFLMDAALGTVHALEWSGANRAGFHPWYAALDAGLRVAATGGEDSISNLHRSKLVGSFRTYVHTGERGLDMEAWFEGLRAGRSFVSSGPLVELTVEGRGPGETLRLEEAPARVAIEARVESITPLRHVQLVWNGEVVREIALSPDRRSARLDEALDVTDSGWLHLRAQGSPEERFPLDVDYVQAFTNPVWVEVGGRPVRSRAAALYGLRWLDRLQELAAAEPGWRSDAEREHVFAQIEEARERFRALAAEADALGVAAEVGPNAPVRPEDAGVDHLLDRQPRSGAPLPGPRPLRGRRRDLPRGGRPTRPPGPAAPPVEGGLADVRALGAGLLGRGGRAWETIWIMEFERLD